MAHEAKRRRIDATTSGDAEEGSSSSFRLTDPGQAEALRSALCSLWREDLLCDLKITVAPPPAPVPSSSSGSGSSGQSLSLSEGSGAHSSAGEGSSKVTEVRLHAAVGAAVSPHLRSLLTGAWRESAGGAGAGATAASSGSPATRDLTVSLDSTIVDGPSLAALVEYAYTGSLEVSGSTALATLSASDYLGMSGAKALCEDFLESKLEPSNVLGVLREATQNGSCGLGLVAAATALVSEQFVAVSAGVEWLSLSQAEVTEVLRRDSLRVPEEACVLAALIRWTEHDTRTRRAAFGTLISDKVAVRLDKVSPTALAELRRSPLMLPKGSLADDLIYDELERRALCSSSGQSVSLSNDRVYRPPPGVFEVPTRCVGTLEGHEGPVYALTTIGDSVVSGSNDNTLKVWDSATWTCVRTSEGHTQSVYALTTIGDLVVSGSNDNTLKVWGS